MSANTEQQSKTVPSDNGTIAQYYQDLILWNSMGFLCRCTNHLELASRRTQREDWGHFLPKFLAVADSNRYCIVLVWPVH